MTNLEFFKKVAQDNANKLKSAVAKGETICTILDMNGKEVRRYYHSGRWNDRPSTIGRYTA